MKVTEKMDSEEFNLSDKICGVKSKVSQEWIWVKDIKEFIELLKQARGNCRECGCMLTDEDINKLAGDKFK